MAPASGRRAAAGFGALMVMIMFSPLAPLLIILAAAVLLSSSSSSSVASAAASSHDVLRVGSTLTPSSPPLISSSSQSFRLSFRPFSTSASSGSESRRYYLAISFSVSPDGPPAWVANRNTSVSSSAYLNVTSSQGLVLIDSAAATEATSEHPVIWSTENDIGNTGRPVTHVQLNDTGNLILFGRNTSLDDNSLAPVLWQSFDHPTDTLLPYQPFSPTTDPLLSQKSYASFDATGSRFSLSFNASGQLLQLSNSRPPPASDNSALSPVTYWSWDPPLAAKINGTSSGFLQLDGNGNLSLYSSGSSAQNFQISSDYGAAAIRRLTLDIDGNLRIYTWDTESRLWVIVWFAFGDECTRVPGLCGIDYAVCTYNPQPVCVCPPGFEPVNKTDISSGCRPVYSDVDYCNTTKYVVLRNIDYPYNEIWNGPGKSLTECKDMCSNDCQCIGLVYWMDGSGYCWMKSKFQLAGHPSPPQTYVVFLKISDSDPTNVDSSGAIDGSTGVAAWSSASASLIGSLPSITTNTTSTSPVAGNGSPAPPGQVINKDSKNPSTTVIVLAAALAGQLICFVVFLAVLIAKLRSKNQQCQLYENLAQINASADRRLLQGVSGLLPIVCSYELLEAATNNFAHELGAGAFGTVYKGTLPTSGEAVAVKRLEGLSQKEKQFRAEIATLGKIHHMNLLRLVGFCADGEHRMLVYEYMEKGSLDNYLFDIDDNSRFHSRSVSSVNDNSQQIPTTSNDGATDHQLARWATRFQVVLGVARGLTYLHEECLDCILHCDIKPQNILLDNHYNPKVADFGLAYLFSRDHTVRMTTIRGTRGYLAPEWLSYRSITAKADVYSFGMLAMEIVSGRRNYLHTESAMDLEADNRWCFPVWAYGRKVEEVVDSRVREVVAAQVEAVMKVAYCCIQSDPDLRPSMSKVVHMLEGSLPLPEQAPPPLFLNDAHHSDASGSPNKARSSSYQSSAISTIVAR